MPVAQAAWLASGRSTLAGTEAKAASWKTQSTPSTARATTSASVTSPSMNSIRSRKPSRFGEVAGREVVEHADAVAAADQAPRRCASR